MAQGSGEHSVWATRFIWTSVGMGAVAFALFALMLYLQFFGRPISRAMAAGGVAVWLLIGFVGFLIAVVATATTALFYQHIEVNIGRTYTGARSILAWLHLVLMSVGAVAASIMLIYVGYTGGVAMVPENLGGGGKDAFWVHENVAGDFPTPIGVALTIASLGVLLGGLGYVLSWLSKPERE